MLVVALAGPSGVGKSTIAQKYFRPLGFHEIALADEVKIRAIATGVAEYEDVFSGAKPAAVRTWLQAEGTERGRLVFGEDVWLRALFARLRMTRERTGQSLFVVSDVRFPNEVHYIRQHGGLVFRVHAPSRIGSNGLDARQASHQSETAVYQIARADVDGCLLNEPDKEHTVEWQVRAHLHMALRSRPVAVPVPLPPATTYLSLAEKLGVLRACEQALG